MTKAETPGDLELPGLREDIQLLPGAETTGGEPTWVVFDPVRNRYFRIGWPAFQLLSRWTTGSATQLVEQVLDETTCEIDLQDVKQLIQFLYSNNLTLTSPGDTSADFTEQHDATQSNRLNWLLRNYLFLRFPLIRPDALLQKMARYLDPLFTTFARNVLLVLGATGIFLVTRQWDTFTSTFLYFYSLEGVIFYVLGIVIVKICHELGHALTATRFGCRVATMGVAFLVLFPVLYTDTTDAYRLTSRRKRLLISAAGMLTEFYLALVCIFLWSLLPDGILRSVVFILGTVSFTLTVLINTNPLLRFDGYYFLADWLGIENLQERSFAMGKWQLREILFALGDQPPEVHNPQMHRFLIVFAWATWIYRFFLMMAIALVVYTFFFKLLGFILFLGVLYTFIIVPIMKELVTWWDRRSSVSGLRGTVFLFALIALLLTVFVPWRSTITLPAIIEPDRSATIYPPLAGRIVSTEVEVGDEVNKGQTLLVLESPIVDEELRRIEIEISVLQLRLQRIAASIIDLENLQVLQQQLQEKQSRRAALQEMKARLILRSPIDGTVVELADALHRGRWINDRLAVAFIIDRRELIVRGVLSENDLGRIASQQQARFIPDDLSRATVDATVIDVDQANLTNLDLPYLASVYGGDVAVRRDSNGKLVPETSVYRLQLAIDGKQVKSDQVVRGVAHIQGQPKSFARRAYEIVAAAFVRGAVL